MSSDEVPVPESLVHWGKKRGGWSDAYIMANASHGGSVMIWAVWVSAALLAQIMTSAHDLNILQVFSVMFVSFLIARSDSKMTMPGFVRLILWKSRSGNTNHCFHTWLGRRLIENLCDVHSGLTLLSSRSWQKINKKLNQPWIEINAVIFHKPIKTMPWWLHAVIKAKAGPIKY